jgi:hypothetical protein
MKENGCRPFTKKIINDFECVSFGGGLAIVRAGQNTNLR